MIKKGKYKAAKGRKWKMDRKRRITTKKKHNKGEEVKARHHRNKMWVH